jgi:hypothetical protein
VTRPTPLSFVDAFGWACAHVRCRALLGWLNRLVVVLMPYLRCTACGSKALVAASQCPRCAHPFHLLNARGERVKLSRCRGCGIMHRYDAACHWCGVLPKSSWASPVVWRSAAALLITVAVAGAAWNFGSPLRVDRAPVLRAEPALSSTPVATASVAAPSEPATAGAPAAPVVSDTAPRATADTAVRAVIETDSIVWTSVVARTWVNVRNSASRDSEVVGVIKPSSRALLGTGRAGWRRVRSPEVNGWVDPRHFDPDSLRSNSR